MKHRLKNILIIVFLFIYQLSYSQVSIDNQPERNCIVGIWPTSISQANGLMLNFWPKDINQSKLKEGGIVLPTTNGIELNLNPLGPFAAVMALFHYPLDNESRKPLKDSVDHTIILYYKKINGFQLAFLNLEPTKINGLEIHLSGSYESVVNGISIGIVANKRDKLNGLGVGFIGNFDTEVNGVQIGIFNKANKMKGFQIGLWNTNKKRSLPFINWSF